MNNSQREIVQRITAHVGIAARCDMDKVDALASGDSNDLLVVLAQLLSEHNKIQPDGQRLDHLESCVLAVIGKPATP
jgi:hypothetical protein